MKNKSESMQSKGGKARAKSLSPEQRSEIARKGAAGRWNHPKATHAGELHLGGWVIPCYNLEDGRRVLSQRGFTEILGMRSRRAIGPRIAGLLDNPALKSQKIKDLVLDSRNLIKFLTPKNILGLGYEGSFIVEYCKALLEARRANALGLNTKTYVEAAERLIIALAKVGIAALIDEATGFQEIRDRKALEALLDRYLRKEFAAWAKRFPDEFYKEMFRLRGWTWDGMKVNRPQIVGKYTNNIVYKRLASGVLKELKIRNPINEKGYRKVRHHQYLTEDIGHPALAQHIYAVMGLMRVATDWRNFLSILQRAFPKKGDQLDFDIEIDPEN